MRRLRPLLIAALAVVVLLAGAIAGLFASARYAPDRIAHFAERLLAEPLGPVEVGAVRPAFAWGPAVEVRDLRVPADPAAPEAEIAAERVRVGLDLRRLFQGDFRIARVAVAGLRATVVRTPDGALHPPAAQRLIEAARAREPAGDGDLHGALARVRERTTGWPALVLEDVALRWLDRGAGRDEAWADLAVRGDAALRHPTLTGGVALEANARLVAGGAAARGGVELRAELPEIGTPTAALALSDVDLALAQPWLARLAAAGDAELELAGRLAAHVAWTARDGEERVEVELLGLDVRAAGRRGDGERQTAELASARAAGALVVSPGALAAQRLELALGPLRLAGSARLARPFGDGAHLDLAVAGEPVGVETVRAWLRAAGHPTAQRAADALTAGRLAAWSLRCERASRAAWRAAAEDPVGAWPEGCAVELAVEGVGAKLGDGPPLGGLRGGLRYARDRLELRDVRARLGDDELPALDLAMTGVAAVLASLADGRLPAPVPALPGWFTLERWAQGDRPPGSPSRWQRMEFDASRLEHPALLRPIAGLRAVLEPVPFGWDAQIEDGWWGSARVSGHARKSGAPPGRIAIDARARADGGAPPVDRADPDAWLRGRFAVALTKLGPFRASGVTGRVRIEGARGEIVEGEAALVPRGRLAGEVDVALDQADAVPVSGRLRIENGSVPDLLADLSLGDGSAMTGTAHLSGDLSARLIPRGDILEELTGPVTLKLRDGEINQRMNLLLAIAAASDTFNPFRSRETLPYHEIDGALALERGFVRAESLSLEGPAVRLVANGRVNVIEAPYEVQAVAGVFFFKTLDAVISRVPLVNRLLLGKDDNLWAAWFALTGPWVDPEARVLPQTLLTSGPVGIVTEGVPGFVRSGIETLTRLLGGGAPLEPREPVPAPREAARRPQGPGARP